MKIKHNSININISYPILTNIRNRNKKIKNDTGKIFLKFDHINDFMFNEAFNLTKIKYPKNYNNEQSLSLIFQAHLANLIKIIKSKFKKTEKIIEIGCGKGAFFEILNKNFKNIRGFDTTYQGNNIKIKKRYITEKDEIDEKLIILRHTLEHIPNPYYFLNFLKNISKNNPYILIEVPDFDWIRSKKSFFDITYEHVNYFTLKTLENLFSKKLFFKKKMFGNQYLVIIAKLNDLNKNFLKTAKLKNINISDIFPNLTKQIMSYNNIEKNIFIWGAGSKSLMFLIYLKKLNPLIFKKVKFVVDIDKKKQNKFLQVVNLKIISPEKLSKKFEKGDTIFISNSHYKDEIKKETRVLIKKDVNYRFIEH